MDQPKTLEIVKKIPLFFILGRSRSGTTLLMTLFDTHPNVNIPFESPFITELYKKYAHIIEWNETHLLDFYSDLFKVSWRFDCWKRDDEKLKKDLLECTGKNTYATICKVVMYNFISVYPKKEIFTLGDKNPVYTLKLRKIYKIFPDAHYIYIVRDYRDHLYSMFKVDFLFSITPEIAYQWNYTARSIFHYKKKLQDHLFIVRYEDLISDPLDTMKQLFAFTGVPDHPEALQFYEYKDQYTVRYSEQVLNTFFKSLLRPINPEGLNTWQEKLTEKDILLCDAIAGKYGKKFGYQVKYKSIPFSVRLYLAPRLFLIRLYYIYRYMAHHLPPHWKAKVKSIIPELGILYYRIFNDERNKL